VFDEIFFFIKLAETGSIKETAQALEVSAPTVTRNIQKLEAELNIKLFKGHAHCFDLTPEGKRIYEDFAIHKRNFSNKITKVLQNKGKIKGTLRLALPHSIAESILPPLISWFKKRFSESQLIITYVAGSINLLKDGFDLALSRREPGSNDHKVEILSRVYSKLYATPTYCREFGTPQVLEDLCAHNWIVQTQDNRLINNFEALNLVSGERTIIEYHPQFLLNNALQGLSLALSHQVIVLAPDYFAKREVANGRFNEILPEWGFGENHLYLIRNPHLVSQLEQEVVNFITDLFSANLRVVQND